MVSAFVSRKLAPNGMIPPSVRQPSADNPLYGSCLCGGVRFEVDRAVRLGRVTCHCSRCRKHSGAFRRDAGPACRVRAFASCKARELISVYRPEGGRVKAFCSGLRLEPVRERVARGRPDRDPASGALDGDPRDPAVVPHLRRLEGHPGSSSRTTGCRATTKRRPRAGPSAARRGRDPRRRTPARARRERRTRSCGSWCRSSSLSGWSGLGRGARSGGCARASSLGPRRPVGGVTMRISLGAPGRPPAFGLYSGTPTQVKSRPSSGSATRPGISLSRNVMPEALRAERVGRQVEPTLDEARRELGLAVLAVVEGRSRRPSRSQTNAASAGQALVEGDAVELAAEVSPRAPAPTARASGRCRARNPSTACTTTK